MKRRDTTEANRAEIFVREFGRAAGAFTVAALTYPLAKLLASEYRVQIPPNNWRELDLESAADIIELELPATEPETKPAA